MRNRHRFVLAGGMLAGAVALGCQAPVPLQPTTRTPRVINQVGAMQLTPDTDLALHFEQPCADGVAGYALQALDPRIDFIVVTIKGPSYPDGQEMTPSITREAFGDGCELTKLFEGLSPGEYTFSMNGYKNNPTPGGKRIQTMTSPPQTINVDSTTTETVTLKCDFTTGQVNVKIDCCSPAPPTPTPTATPVPTPTPTLPPVVFEDPLNEGIYGFTVDTRGRPYVFGWDAAGTPQGGGPGRIYRFTPGTPVVSPTPYLDAVTYVQEGDIVDGVFTGLTNIAALGVQTATAARLRIDLRDESPTPTSTRAFPDNGNVYPHHGATALDPATNQFYYAVGVVIFSGTYFEHGRVHKEGTTTPLYDSGSLGNPTPPPISTLPHTMEWAPALGLPVWTTQDGIFKPGASVSVATRLLQGPAYGLRLLRDDASEGFLTRWGWSLDKSIFYFDLATSDLPTAKLTFTNGYPRTIERGADGQYYVFLSETGYAATSPSQFHDRSDRGGVGGPARFRIVKLKWDATTKVLTPDFLVVDNFVNKAASW